MDVPGGYVERPATKLYEPTFWPARTFVHMEHAPAEHGRGLAVFLGGPACVGLTGTGVLEWVALRNAHREWAYRVLPILAHPASGSDPGEHNFEYAIWFTESGDFRANGLPQLARDLTRRFWLPEAALSRCEQADGLVTVDHDQVVVSTIKAADRGEGLIVRLVSHAPQEVSVRLRCAAPVDGARLCDARERDLAGLLVEGQQVEVPVRGALTTVRLLARDV
jgi:alpha-mannosidase